MKKNKKIKKDEIKEKIRKETGFLMNDLKPNNAKKVIEEFIYVMANSYSKCWITLSYLEVIYIENSAFVKNDKKMETVQNATNIIDNIFQDEQMDYSNALEGIIRLSIKDSVIYKILKEDLPILEQIREMIKARKDAKFDYTPIYEELIEFYLNYNYDGNLSIFIEKLNIALKNIVNNESIMKDCFHIKGGTKDEG